MATGSCELGGEDGGVLGAIFGDEELGDGVTTGGVVDDVFDSRWQPASPSASPVHSSVTKAALLIVISGSVEGKCDIRI